jgi:hypothetical protein
MTTPITDEDLRALVLEVLEWLQSKDMSTRDGIAVLGFSLVALVLTAKNAEDLSEQVVATFRASIKEHFDRHPESRQTHPPRPRRTH